MGLLTLLVYQQEIYKLTDFGYAKVYGTSSRADSMVGTLQYVVSHKCMYYGDTRHSKSFVISIIFMHVIFQSSVNL